MGVDVTENGLGGQVQGASAAGAAGPTSWVNFDAVKTPLPSQAQVDGLVGTRTVDSNYRDQILSLLKFTNETTYNYELPVKDSVYYSFSLADMVAPTKAAASEMNAAQKANVRKALDEVTRVTGIKFTETKGAYPASGNKKEGMVFVNEKREVNHNGQDYTRFQDQTTVFEDREGGSKITTLTKNDTLGINPDAKDMGDYAPGGQGFDTLIHEIGHALGLSHPFGDSTPDWSKHPITVMSYDFSSSMSQYGSLDIDALHWIYGDDGLLGVKGLTVDPKTFAPVANGMDASSSGWTPGSGGGGGKASQAVPELTEYVLTFTDGAPDLVECVPGTFVTGAPVWGVGPDGQPALFALAPVLVERDPVDGYLIEPYTGIVTPLASDPSSQPGITQSVDENGHPVISVVTDTITYDCGFTPSALSGPASLTADASLAQAQAGLDWPRNPFARGVFAAS